MTRAARGRPADAAAGEAARAALAARPAGAAAARARLALAAALRASGQDAEAAAAFAAALPELPDAVLREAAAAEERLARTAAHPAPPPQRSQPPAPGEELEAVASLVAGARHAEALGALDTLSAPGLPPEPAARAEALRALALLALGHTAEAEAAANLALAGQPDAGTRAAAELALARAAARSARHAEAAALYRRLSRWRGPVPGVPARMQATLADDCAFLAAWLPYDAGHFAEAARSLRAFVAARPRSPRLDDARWFEAWSALRTGDRDDARRRLGRLVAGVNGAGALYWLGRLARDPASGRRLYRRALAAAGPDSWYGQLAAARLRAAGDLPPTWSPPPGGPPPDGPGPGIAGSRVAGAAELAGAGLRGPALKALRAAATSATDPAAAWRIAQLAALLGDANLPLEMARNHLPPTRRALRWAHPDPWPWRTGALAESAGLAPSLLLAVVRRESAFDPAARSIAGAVGLLQLLPSTAVRLTAAAGVPGERAGVDGDNALPLGAWYLGLLVDRFGHPAAALAAYNAGPATAAAWGAKHAGLPLDEWVEDLPFRETRRYLKAVLADARVYAALREGAELGIDGLAPVPAPGEGVSF